MRCPRCKGTGIVADDYAMSERDRELYEHAKELLGIVRGVDDAVAALARDKKCARSTAARWVRRAVNER